MRALTLFILATISPYLFADRPAWVDSPQESGFDYAIVGSAMPQAMGEAAQFRQAMFAARQEFSANQSVIIHSKQTIEADTESKSSSSETYSNAGGLMQFHDLILKDQWQDPETGELFLLYSADN